MPDNKQYNGNYGRHTAGDRLDSRSNTKDTSRPRQAQTIRQGAMSPSKSTVPGATRSSYAVRKSTYTPAKSIRKISSDEYQALSEKGYRKPGDSLKKVTASKISAAKLLEIQRRRELKRKRIRRNRIIASSILALIIAMIVFMTATIGTSSGSVKYHKIFNTEAKTDLIGSQLISVKGSLPKFHWPTSGEGAVYVMGEGLVAASGNQKTVPIASLTKMMTAYIILKDHPLSSNQNGPKVTIDQADVAEYLYDDQNDLSNVKVVNGEVLTERQLLEALLIPSGDNIADILAKWDAGSLAGFVAKMNAEAKALGLVGTHYVDANGVHFGSSSTAVDQVKLASLLMRNQTIRSIVRNASLPFPVVGSITNYNPALGQDGIIGVKSGFTGHAGGCLVVGAFDKIGSHSVLVLVGVTGQKNGLYQAAAADETILAQARKAFVLYSLPEKDKILGYVYPGWGQVKVPLRTENHSSQVVAWPTMKMQISLEVPNISLPGRHRLSRVGLLDIKNNGNIIKSLPVLNLQATPALPSDYKIIRRR